MSIKSFIAGAPGRNTTDAGLLALRVLAGLSLFLKHGLEKLTGYSSMVQNFPDPIHVGSHVGLAFALFADGICSILIVIGLATRPASVIVLINLLTAFTFIHHGEFFGGPHDHEQLVVLYITAAATLLLTGPGRFSIDRLFQSAD